VKADRMFWEDDHANAAVVNKPVAIDNLVRRVLEIMI
jgi:hypothetical protein